MPTDTGIVTALAHPLRARILAVLDEGEASRVELARLLEEKLGNVSYHVWVLRDLGLIEETRTTPRRGALDHRYRSRTRDRTLVNVECALTRAGGPTWTTPSMPWAASSPGSRPSTRAP